MQPIVLASRSALNFLSQQRVNEQYFPFTWGPTLHAARVSMAYQANARRSQGRLPFITSVAGFLVMSWGGSFLSHIMLGLPPPQLYDMPLYTNYLMVHFLLSFVFTLFPALLDPKIFDTLLFPLDAFLRTNSVTNTLALLKKGPSAYVSSPLSHFILGALAASGGGLSAATFSTWSPEWSFSTPPFLRASAGVWNTLDVWGGALVAIIYSTTTGSPAFSNLAIQLGATKKNQLSTTDAKALSGTVLAALFGARAIIVHWLQAPQNPDQGGKNKGKVANKVKAA